jgi:hypothetical protein
MNEHSGEKENLFESRFHDFHSMNRDELFSFNKANEILSHFFSGLIFSGSCPELDSGFLPSLSASGGRKVQIKIKSACF